jgi:uncharacterized protein
MQESRAGKIPGWPHLIAVLLLLGCFPWFLTSSGISALATMPSDSPDHRAAVLRFCAAAIVFLWIVCAVVIADVRKSCPNGVRHLIGIDNAKRAGIWKTALQMLLVLFALVLVGGASNALLAHWGSNPSAMQGMIATTSLEASAFLLTALTAGFAEELIFRGYLQQQFLTLTGSIFAASCLQIAIFTLGHLYQGIGRLLPVLLIACVLTASARWTKSLLPGMIAHGLGDGLVAIAYLLHSPRH